MTVMQEGKGFLKLPKDCGAYRYRGRVERERYLGLFKRETGSGVVCFAGEVREGRE